ncbi:MAG TPA: phosphatidylglycerol lysyltransferase domain-containing protein [Syntrophales bacterium]|nr:phosphatidylglycerol lysyltransferase domain-containing protein [Syntrophales bacterium]
MNFKKLEIADYPALKHFFSNIPYRLSIYSLPSLIAWSNCVFEARYAVDGELLIISNESEMRPEERHLILPLSLSGDVLPEKLLDLAVRLGFQSYWYIPGDYVERHRQGLEPLFVMEEQEEFEDYVYLAEDLAHLKGNRYVRKRNLIHQFEREFMTNGVRVHVEPITAASVPECLAFLEAWCKQRDCDVDEDIDLACERMAVITSLENFEALELKGIQIRVDGAVNAFGIAARLNEEMGILSYEKAYSDVKGLYQYLDNECAKHLFAGYRYINKESDMSLPNLARMKRSYRPVMRVKSCKLTLK